MVFRQEKYTRDDLFIWCPRCKRTEGDVFPTDYEDKVWTANGLDGSGPYIAGVLCGACSKKNRSEVYHSRSIFPLTHP